MTIEDLIRKLGAHPLVLLVFLAAPLLLSLVLPKLHKPGGGVRAPWRYVYAAIIYWVTFPGVCAGVLSAYQLFIRHGDLLQVNVLVYVLPMVVMGATLAIVARNVDLGLIPGFDRLSGFVSTVAVTFILALIILKLRIRLLFFGSIWTFVLFIAILYCLLRAGLRAMGGEKSKRIGQS